MKNDFLHASYLGFDRSRLIWLTAFDWTARTRFYQNPNFLTHVESWKAQPLSDKNPDTFKIVFFYESASQTHETSQKSAYLNRIFLKQLSILTRRR